MLIFRSLTILLAVVTSSSLHAGRNDTLYAENTLLPVDTITTDTASSSRYTSLFIIGENGPVSFPSPSKRGKIDLYDTIDTPLNSSFFDTSATSSYSIKPRWYKSRLVRSSIFPLAMIGYSLTVMKDNGIYSSYDAKRDIRKAFGSYRSKVDDYLVWIPYAELGMLNLFKIRCKTDALNTSLLILKSELIMAAIVLPVKQFSNQLRPDSSNWHSFPSGHTANAFVAASVVHKEYRHLSPWYGVGAYTVAASVAAFRMINNRHWQSDVIAGAGIGLLATHIAYATHRYRWGRKDVCFVPAIGQGRYGGALVCQF